LDTKLITTIIMVATVVGLIGWDIYVAATPIRGDTISEIIRQAAYKHPMIPFTLGVLIGHWFWSR
jgi:uncharacterized membrane protein